MVSRKEVQNTMQVSNRVTKPGLKLLDPGQNRVREVS